MSSAPSTVSSILAQRILHTSSKTLFALAGATYAPLLMAFEDGGGTIIGGRHESGTVVSLISKRNHSPDIIPRSCMRLEQFIQHSLSCAI